jgi:hypothetical protein
MNTQSYLNYWKESGEKLYTYSPALFEKSTLDEETISFLTTCGFPSDTAPALSFIEVQEDKLYTPNEAFKIDFAELGDFLMFGTNGSGDPVCIDTTEKNIVVYLNHDNYFERVFINRSVPQFAFCLTKYRQFIYSLIEKSSGEYIRRKFSDKEFEDLKKGLLQVDPICMNEESFWHDELKGLLWERDNE